MFVCTDHHFVFSGKGSIFLTTKLRSEHTLLMIVDTQKLVLVFLFLACAIFHL